MLAHTGQVIERLLRGEFICKITDEEGWRHLKTPANRERIEEYLGKINRTVSSVGTGSEIDVFFCSYVQIGEEERKVLSQQFKDICTSLTPLVEWLVLVQEAITQDIPLTEGTPIRLPDLQTLIEDTPAFREQLEKISHYPLFGSTSNNIDNQIKLVFKRLCELGYLIRPNTEKQIYIATGKLDYLYEVIRFIDETENLKLEDYAEVQTTQSSLL